MINILPVPPASRPSRDLQASATVRFRTAPPVRRTPVPLSRRFFQICVSVAAEMTEGAGLTALEFAALPYLSRKTGDPGIDQNGLAARIGIDRNSASLLLDHLEEKGLVKRRIDAADRRCRRLFLTPKGERVLERLRPAANAGNDRILAPLEPGERELLLDLLVRVVEGNWTHARPGAGRRKRGSLQHH